MRVSLVYFIWNLWVEPAVSSLWL